MEAGGGIALEQVVSMRRRHLMSALKISHNERWSMSGINIRFFTLIQVSRGSFAYDPSWPREERISVSATRTIRQDWPSVEP